MCPLGIGQEVFAKVHDDTKLSKLMLDAQDLKLDKIRHGHDQVHNFFCESEVVLTELFKVTQQKITKEETQSLENMCNDLGKIT